MQLFRAEENLAGNDRPRYDSQTVREVLARASEIETQAEPELLTVAQVEALGSELGLSPEAVRRALGEKGVVGSVVPATSARKRVLVPLTQEQVKAAYSFTLWYALICFPVIFGVAGAMRSGTTSTEIAAPIASIVALVIPIYLACRSGFLAKRVGVAAVGGFLSVLLISCVAFLAGMMADRSININGVITIIFWQVLYGAIAGSTGAWVRHWWDGLPRNSDR